MSEMETGVAQTLALRRKTRVEAMDLVFDFGVDVSVAQGQPGDIASEFARRQTRIQLTGDEKTCQIRAGEAQWEYVFKMCFCRFSADQDGHRHRYRY